MDPELPDAVAEFLARPNPAVMATIAKDGTPIAVATWYLFEPDGRILVNFDAERLRLGHLRRDPRFALDVLDATDWYAHISLQLAVAEFTDDVDLNDIDSLSTLYLGRPYDNRNRPRVSARAEVRRWMGWGIPRE